MPFNLTFSNFSPKLFMVIHRKPVKFFKTFKFRKFWKCNRRRSTCFLERTEPDKFSKNSRRRKHSLIRFRKFLKFQNRILSDVQILFYSSESGESFVEHPHRFPPTDRACGRQNTELSAYLTHESGQMPNFEFYESVSNRKIWKGRTKRSRKTSFRTINFEKFSQILRLDLSYKLFHS